jgi:hypothetical protein
MQNSSQNSFVGLDVDAEIWNKKEEQPYKFPFPLLALIFVILMLLLVNVGCAPISTGQAADLADPGAVLFLDDFSETPSGWGIWSRDGAKVEYHNEGLRIWVTETQYDFWSVAGKNFTNVQVEVDATKLDGPDDNDFGVLCRYLDKNNFYMLVVSSDGYYGIAKMKGGQYSMIGSDQLQYTGSAIKPGKNSNHLRADCVGSTLRLHANGKLLMEAIDKDFYSGDVGVLAGAYNTPGVDILFDNFVVKKP